MDLKKTQMHLIKYLQAVFLFAFAFNTGFSQSPGTFTPSQNKEDFAKSIDFSAFKKQIVSEVGMSEENQKLFFDLYAFEYLTNDELSIQKKVANGSITRSNLTSYLNDLKAKYIERYQDFLSIEAEKPHLHTENKRLEVANGPCTNMGFENGTFQGWTGEMQDRNVGQYNSNQNPLPTPVPGPMQNGFLQHCIMTPAMRDPFIQNLTVVPPGKTRSVRIGNVVPGGHVARIRQSFLVDSSNLIFTYRYAVVLEDPDGAAGHDGLNSPHFQVSLKDANGDQVTCAGYSVVVEKNLASYTHVCVDASDAQRIQNYGCPAGAMGSDGSPSVRVDRVFNPTNDNCGNGIRDIYYRNWTTGSIVLDQYIGQNVTIEFTAADCVPDGHMGYAYVNTECSSLNLSVPGYICSGKQTKTISAPIGFASYSWEAQDGGVIQGSTTGQTIRVTHAGHYKVTVIPISDSDVPCPYEITYTMLEHCPPPNLTKTFCETVKGSGQATGIDLSLYENEVVDTIPTGKVISWHRALPANAGNRINPTSNLTVSNGTKYYPIIDYATFPNDTTMVTFVVNAKPNANFNTIPPVCLNTPAFNITGASPSGGTFSGPHVTSAGLFTPSNAGNFNIQYKVTNAQGCTDSVTKVAEVHTPPTVVAQGDTTICFINKALDLPVSATATSFDSLVWTSSHGTFANRRSTATTLSINGTAPFEQTITATATAYKRYCPSAKDNISINTRQLPTVAAPSDTLICTQGGSTSFLAKAKVSYQDSIHWSGANVVFSSPTSLSSNATVSSVYPQKPTFTLTLTAFKQGCPEVKDAYVVTLNPFPKVSTPQDSSFCATIETFPLNGLTQGTDSVRWRASSFLGTFTNPRTASTSFSRAASVDTLSALFILTGYTKSCGIASDTTRISLQAVPTLSLSAPDSVCASIPKIDASAISANARGMNWQTDGGVLLPNASAAQISYAPTSSEINTGAVWLRAFQLPKTIQLCPLKKDSIKIVIYDPPTVTAPFDTILCQPNPTVNLSLKASATGADSLVWASSGATAPIPQKGLNSSFTVSNSDPFQVFLTAYRKGCLPVSDTSLVSFEQRSKVSITTQPTCLQDERVLLNGSSTKGGIKSTGVWKSSGMGQFTSPLDSLSSNAYIPSGQDLTKGEVSLTVSSTNQKYCPAADTTIIWKFVPLPLSNSGPDTTLCRGFSFTRSAANNPTWKYEWKHVESGVILSTSPSVSYTSSADSSTLKLTVVNSRNCKAADSMVIATLNAPILALPPKLCYYSPTTITTTIQNMPPIGDLYWKKYGTRVPGNSPSILVDGIGTYSYHYEYKGCLATATLNSLALPDLKVPNIEGCQNTQVEFTADPIPGATYFWQNFSTVSNKYKLNSGNGISNFKVLVIDANGCKDSTTANVTVYPFPAFDLSGANFCPGQSKSIIATLKQPSLESTYPLSYTWYRNGEPLSAFTWKQLPYSVPGSYSLELSLHGCVSRDTAVTSYHPSPKINIPLTYKHCFETDPPLELRSNLFTKYTWYSDEGFVDTSRSIRVSPQRDKYYYLKVENSYGCLDSAQLLVRKVCPPRLFVPNVITPESQDVNAGLAIFGAHYTNFEITIFSRWGEVIFNSKDSKHVWNGIYKNENMPIGNYPWLVTYEGDTEEYKGPYKKTGEVTVVR